MERIVEFSPAYDKRSSDPGKNYGVHGVDLRFVLRGPRGAVQFLLLTNWYLPNVTDELCAKAVGLDASRIRLLLLPWPADLGYHSLKRRYKSQSRRSCPYVDGGKCYYDGSGLNADPVYERLLREGDAGVWAALEEYYVQTFGAEQESSA